MNVKNKIKILNDLNKEQKAAVIKTEGPLRIIAGAGSGKTKVLTRKIAYLVEVANKDPKKIIALTFTKKAANEMKERVEEIIGEKANKIIILTFHSLCAKFLQQEINVIEGFNSKFIILDSTDQVQLLKEIYKKYSFSHTVISYHSMLEFISKNKINYVFPKDLITTTTNEISKVYATVYQEYENETKKSKSLDYDDLLIYTKNILLNNSEILHRWQSKFDYFLIDEFQDTSKIQYDIIALLLKKNNITIVGDPDQTIYSWRGAEITFINEFDKMYPEATTIILHQNYRSTQNILNVANKLISHNHNRLPKNLDTNNEKGCEIEYYQGNSQESETLWIVSKINLLKKSKVQLKDIAILYRSNFYSRAIEDGLIQESIPHKVIDGQKFYERAEIKDAISFLRCIWEPNDISLKRIINIPARKIGSVTLEKIIDFANTKNMSLWESWIKYFNQINIPKESKENLFKFIKITQKHKAALLKKISISKVLESFLNEIKYLEFIKENKVSDVAQNKFENIKEFLKSIKIWENKHPDKTIDDYLEEISLTALASEDVNNMNYISLMTIHSAKGLEFKNVFLIGLNEEIFPTQRAIEENEEENNLKIEEERRLAYVAITRARERLFLSGSKGWMFENKQSKKQPSRFLKEMGIDLDNYESNATFSDYLSPNLKVNKKFTSGDRIVHTNFGEGIVLDVNGDVLVIEFKNKNIGIKQLLKNHKSIERL